MALREFDHLCIEVLLFLEIVVLLKAIIDVEVLLHLVSTVIDLFCGRLLEDAEFKQPRRQFRLE